MRPYVAHASRLARTLGVGTPCGVAPGVELDARCEPPLRILDVYLAHGAELPLGEALAGLLDGGIGRVCLREGEGAARLQNLLLELLRLLEREGHGLLYDHVESLVQGHHCRLEVGDVGRDDRYEIHTLPVGKGRLLLDHLGVGEVDAVVGQKVLAARGERNVGVGAETAAYQLYAVIHESCGVVYGSDEGVVAPTYHPHPEFSVHSIRGLIWLRLVGVSGCACVIFGGASCPVERRRRVRRGGLCRHASGQEQVNKIMSYFKEQVYFARVGKSIGIREECRAGRWLSAYLAR